MLSTVLSIIGLVFALAATIVVWIKIVPEKKRPNLNRFFRYIHDLFNFKSLWLERILKFLYIFETFFCIIGGFFLLFNFQTYEDILFNDIFSSSSSSHTYTVWNGWTGLLLMTLGPIVARILFEFLMMLILLVKNTMEINDKLNAQPGSRFNEKLLNRQQNEESVKYTKSQQQSQQTQQ